jgi:RNA polymerase sigma factor (sigma-70 family)
MTGRPDQTVDDTMVFADWYRAQHGRVLTTIMVVTGRPSLAREATDEAFARALARWPQVSTMTSPGGWVVRVAHNYARRTARRESMEQAILRRARRDEVVEGPAGEAWALVKDLTPQQRAVVTLRYVADLPEAEIGRILGISRGTVSSHHSAALDGLRKRLVMDDVEERWAP